MKIIHLSDLHLGKRVNEFSMLEDQDYILRKILEIVDNERPDAVVIAGDVYDKPLPPAEAVRLFDFFLTELSNRDVDVLTIYGNHDSPERVAFGEEIFKRGGIYISPVYGGDIRPVKFNDEYGGINFWLMPYLKPSQVRLALNDENISGYTEACAAVIEKMQIDSSMRNVLVCHQFVTGALRSDSEEISVGGADNVDISVFDGFDYVALGHLHSPQQVTKPTVRYCGSPLKYSLSEISQKKSLTIVEFRDKGDIAVREIPLIPKRDMRKIRGEYNEITLKANYENTPQDDYLHIVLTDPEDIPDALGRLRAIYPNIMKLEYDNARTRSYAQSAAAQDVSSKTPYELFGEFYEKQNGAPLNEEQKELLERLISKIWDDGEG